MTSQRINGSGELLWESYLVDSKCKWFNCVEINTKGAITHAYYHIKKGNTMDREMLIFCFLNPEE